MQTVDPTLLNEYISQRRDRLLQRDRRTAAEAFLERAKGWALIILALGVAIAFSLWTLMREPEAREIAIRTPPNLTAPTLPRPPAPNSVPVISNYVIFHKAEWDRSGYGSVTTGIEYDASNSQMINDQWCYVDRRYKSDGWSSVQKITVDLGSIRSGKNLEDVTYSKAKHGSIGVSKADFERAKKLCQFNL